MTNKVQKRATSDIDEDVVRLRAELAERDAELRQRAETIVELTARLEATETKSPGGREADVHDSVRRIAMAERRFQLIETTLEDRTRVIGELRLALQAKEAELEQLRTVAAALEFAAAERLELLTRNEEHLARLRADFERRFAGDADVPEIEALRRTAQERLEALQVVTNEAERRAVILAELTAVVDDQTREIESLRSAGHTRGKR